MEVFESRFYMELDGLNIIDVKDLDAGLYQISGGLQSLSPYTLSVNGVLDYVDEFTKTLFINFEGGDFNISVLEPVEFTYISLVLSRWE